MTCHLKNYCVSVSAGSVAALERSCFLLLEVLGCTLKTVARIETQLVLVLICVYSVLDNFSVSFCVLLVSIFLSPPVKRYCHHWLQNRRHSGINKVEFRNSLRIFEDSKC